MYPYYGLSETEYQLMKLFWTRQEPLLFSDVLAHCNEELHLNWAATTAQTYLSRLMMKGVLETNGKRYRKSYLAHLTEEELAQKYAVQVVKESFGGSVKNLLTALLRDTTLTQNEADELKQILDSCLPDHS